MDDTPRFTTIHSRFWVVGGWAKDRSDGEMIDTFPRFYDALKSARAWIGPRHYAWTEVHDTMHRKSRPLIQARCVCAGFNGPDAPGSETVF